VRMFDSPQSLVNATLSLMVSHGVNISKDKPPIADKFRSKVIYGARLPDKKPVGK